MPTVADLLAPPDAAPSAPQAAGVPAPPPGFVPANDGANAPQPPPGFVPEGNVKRSFGDSFGMGVRGLITGGAGLADFAANAVNAPINLASVALTGHDALPTSSATAAANKLADNLGLSAPVTRAEKLRNSVIEGATQGLATAGLAAPLAGAAGTTGTVAKMLASQPVADVVSGAAAGAGQEGTRQAGGGPIAQTLAGLAAGLAGGLGAHAITPAAAERVAARFGPKAAEAVSSAPPEAAINPKGELTDEGREIAAQSGLHPDDLKAAYEEAAQPDPAPAAPAEPAPAAGNDNYTARPQPGPEAAPAPPQAAPEAIAEPSPTPAPASTVDRLAQAESEGVNLSKGQATKDFATQDAENTLKAQASGEGEKARQFFTRQQEQIAGAVDRFKQAVGDPQSSPAERGQQVKDALLEMRQSGKAGINALYTQAREAASGLGDNAKTLLDLDTAPLLAKLREIQVDETIPQQARTALRQQMAKYGLIGVDPTTVEGITTVALKDAEGNTAERIKFPGPQQRLTVENAESLRRTVNDLYEADTSKRTQALKPLIDDAVSEAVERAASQGVGPVGQLYKTARKAFQDQQHTFHAKDVVQNVIDWKKGTKTAVVQPENVIKTILGPGKESISNLQKLKAVLLSKPTEKSRGAWTAIQAHSVAHIFDQALSPRGEISGARLDTAIKKFGPDKLKLILSPEDFGQLMKLRRIIGDATIPLQGTTNPSSTAYKIMNVLGAQGTKLGALAHFAPGIGPLAHAAHGLYKVGAEAAQSRGVLKGVTEFSGEHAAKADAPKTDPVDYARRFVNTAGSANILTPLMVSAANEERP